MKRTLEITMKVVYDDEGGRIDPIKMVKRDLADAVNEPKPRGALSRVFFCADSVEVGEPREITNRPQNPIVMG